jgi:phosphoglycerate dehydrogenase-like enzyme
MPATAPCIAISKRALDAWQPLIDAAALPVRYAAIVDAQTALLDGKQVDAATLPVEAVWLTVDALLGPTKPTFEHLLPAWRELRWAHSVGAGYDMAILQALLKRGVRLTVSHVNAIPIAEYIIRGVLERFQQSDRLRRLRAEHELPRQDFREIYGGTWLIYGLGAIGARTAERARAFGARVIGVRRNPTGKEPVDKMIRPNRVAQHLGRADVVVICAPLTAETENLVDAEFLSHMKKDAVLVNVARAALLDEPALLAALDSGRLDWAVLDVHTPEEMFLQQKVRVDDSPLWTHPKIELTPHIASCGAGRHRRAAQLFVDNLRRYLAGEPLPDEVS